MRYTQITDDQVTQALEAIGVKTLDDLFATIPSKLRLGRDLNIPKGLSEMALLTDVGELASRTMSCDNLVCFLGGGAYDHFIPTLVDAIASETDFLTAYTPYQAEASQGILQLFYEFQTMICQLTGMEVANASLYEGSTAATEAVLMATSITKRNRVLVADTVHPDTRRVLRTYGQSRNLELITVATDRGVINDGALADLLDDSIAAILVQSPNFYGCLERVDRIAPLAHAQGALIIVSTDPLAGGILKPPGAWDVDIVVGEGQALGVPLQYGGPYLGLLASREKFLRKMPGRIVGTTTDAVGRRGFCLVMQTREQHIKRDRATSNICTNQGLLAIRAAIYMAALGRSGIAQVAQLCFDNAHYAADRLAKLEGYELRFDAPFFKEFVVKSSKNVDRVLRSCRKRGILGGVALGPFDSSLEDCILVAVTEKRTKSQIDDWIAALECA